jgi:hypothetical protein
MPIRFEKDALHTAAATLPRAIAVKAMLDCTVEGSSVRNSRPCNTNGDSTRTLPSASPSSGKIAKVVARTAR